MHEGENIGHPASHGCIRMPREFAIKLFSVTKVGVRVIIARSELKPVAFADAHLFVHKAMPAPAPAAAAPAAPEATKTAQAGDDNKRTDAGAVPAVPEPAKPAQTDDTKTTAAVVDPPKPETAATAAPAVIEAVQAGDQGKALAAAEPAKSESLAAAAAKAAPQAPPPRQDGLAKTVDAPPAPAATDKLRGSVATPAVSPDPPADAMPAAKPTTVVDTAPATKGPISIFVSRKEKKIYVRQNFTPLFYAPVTIDHPEQGFGTHVFTALAYLGDGSTLRWNVVSLPGETPKVKRDAGNDRRAARHGRREEPVARPVARPVGDLPPPQTPAEALARIDIPQDAIDRISALIVPGSSLVVSDQGLGEETGEGTDFIVVTR
jgi:hypothetical protein